MSFFLDDLWKCSQQKFYYKNTLFYEIFFDTRHIIEGKNGVYFCCEKNFNKAKNYINEAIEKNIIAIVSPFKIDIRTCPILIYSNPIKLLQKFAKKHLRKFKNLKKITIIGNNDKILIKEWLFNCLNDTYSVIHSPNNYNSQIGVPISVLETKKYHKIAIFQCAISSIKKMRRIENIIKPQIGILTNIDKNHLKNFSSKKKIILEICLLFKHVEKIFFYCNSQITLNFFKKKIKKKEIISIGTKKFCDVQFITFKKKIIHIKIHAKVYQFKVIVKKLENLFDLLIIIAVLYDLGFSQEQIQEKIFRLKSITISLEITRGIFNSMIINDKYSLNLISMKIAVNKLIYLSNNKKIIIIMDSFLDKDIHFNLYQDIIKFLNSTKLDYVFLIGNFRKKHKKIAFNRVLFLSSFKKLICNFNTVEIKNSSILIKGNQIFKLKKFINCIQYQVHNTILEIDVNSIFHNIKIFKKLLNSNTKIMAMIKANAYGIGSYELAKFLQYYKIDYLSVACPDEGVVLRKNGINIPIMVINYDYNSYDNMINYQLEPEIYNLKTFIFFLKKIKEKKHQKKYPIPIHIKINSGMHRLGFELKELDNLIKIIKKNILYIYIKSIFTHLVSTDNKKNHDFTLKQINNFEKGYKKITSQLHYKPFKHVLNTHGIINYGDYQFDMVRIGIGMYGYVSDKQIQKKLKNVITLKTKISQIFYLKKGESVGYNRMFITNKNIKIATIPIGYADGIFRKLGNGNFYVLINNKKIKIIGDICMDMMMIECKSIDYNDEEDVIIYGKNNSINNVAKLCKTIPYEILTSISSRVKRVFVEN